jgi:hypothetical protein
LAGLLQGKSIGFLPTKVHLPTQQYFKKSGWSDDTRCVIDDLILLKYAATFLRVNQGVLVEAVSKGAIEPASSCGRNGSLHRSMKRR